MKNTLRILVLTVAAGMVSLSQAALAQYRSNTARVTIPFAFRYGSSLLPAGTYTLSAQDRDLTMLRGANRTLLAITYSGSINRQIQQGQVIFDKIGNRYFMRTILMPGSGDAITLNAPAAERHLQKELASRGEKTVQVAVSVLPNNSDRQGL